MGCIVFEDNQITPESGETVLDALNRHGHEIPSGCRSGVCQSCLMAVESGSVPDQAITALSPSQQALNYFLSCQCVPDEPISVRRIASGALRQTATVVEKTMLSDQVVGLRLNADLVYLPGQYVTLWKNDQLGRSYSLASVPGQDNSLEFHIKTIEAGQFSPWVRDELQPGDTLELQGPMGQCIFTADPEQPLLMCCIGTGLAPIYGILKQAICAGHTGPIHLVIGARHASGFYLIDELNQLASEHPALTIYRLAMEADETPESDWVQGDLYNFCKTKFPDLKGWRVFLCGGDHFVKKMRKQCFLFGAAMRDISADAFIAFSA